MTLISLVSLSQALCKEYNAKIKLHTIRHAMVGQLREPAPGQLDYYNLPRSFGNTATVTLLVIILTNLRLHLVLIGHMQKEQSIITKINA